VVASDEQLLEPGSAARTARTGHDAQRGPGVDRLFTSLHMMHAGVLVRDRGLGCAPRDVIDQDRSGRRQRLQPRCRVDRVAQHHPLALGGHVDRCVSGQQAGSHPELGHPQLIAERGHGLRQREGRADRPLRVILAGDGSSPNRHHGIADELLDGPAVALDQRPAALEVTRQQFAYLFGIAVLAQRREPDEIREQHRHEATLGNLDLHRGRGPDGRRAAAGTGEWRSAFAAETIPRLGGCPTRRARNLQSCAALNAESPSGPVVRAAPPAVHVLPSYSGPQA
jgi:hypothetical protein